MTMAPLDPQHGDFANDTFDRAQAAFNAEWPKMAVAVKTMLDARRQAQCSRQPSDVEAFRVGESQFLTAQARFFTVAGTLACALTAREEDRRRAALTEPNED